MKEGALVWERTDDWKPWVKYRVRRIKWTRGCYMVTLQRLEPPFFKWGREVAASFCRETVPEEDTAVVSDMILTKPGGAGFSAPHPYLSTACYHGEHALCPKTCKYCGVSCACDCHEPLSVVQAAPPPSRTTTMSPKE